MICPTTSRGVNAVALMRTRMTIDTRGSSRRNDNAPGVFVAVVRATQSSSPARSSDTAERIEARRPSGSADMPSPCVPKICLLKLAMDNMLAITGAFRLLKRFSNDPAETRSITPKRQPSAI